MSLLSVMPLALGVAAGQSSAPASPPPPVITIPARDPSAQAGPHLSVWDAGEVTCADGRRLAGSLIGAPTPVRLSRSMDAMPPMTFGFTLGADGQARSITSSGDAVGLARAMDIPPAIAGARFPATATPVHCEVTFTESIVAMDKAELEDLILLIAYRGPREVPPSAFTRFAPGTCGERPRPRPLTVSYPDFRAIPNPSGRRDWVFLTYDTDAKGNAVDITIAGTSGNADLDAAAAAALKQSRFTEGNRTGCFRYFWSGHSTVTAPERPPLDSYGERPEACNAEGRWAVEPNLVYPEIYRRRAIEGWAVLRYDVAPWGEIGNIEVVEAQPAQSLGAFAVPILRSARYVEQGAGLKGCITSVRFRLPDRDQERESEAEAAD